MITTQVVSSYQHELHGKRCSDCSNRFRVGQVVLIVDRGRNVYVDGEIFYHAHCVRAVLDDAPPEHASVVTDAPPDFWAEARSEREREAVA